MLTIEDIAQAANVAKSTVSRVLNNSGYVGKETRKRVEKVIAESNYTPWVTARNLSKQMSNTIGVVVSEITIQIAPRTKRNRRFGCCGRR